MGNLATRSAVQVLDGSDILRGSQTVALPEANCMSQRAMWPSSLAGEATPGHLSIWDITSPESPTLIRRLSAGSGFPDDFANAHSIGIPIDGSSVFVESFSSHYLIQVDPTTNEGSERTARRMASTPRTGFTCSLIARSTRSNIAFKSAGSVSGFIKAHLSHTSPLNRVITT